ncbi:ESX-1 secretion-associated protein, partial [Mycobacterium sp. ITM-2017-0098]
THATDLDATAARLRTLGPSPMFGPVGARFVASLLHAVEREVGALTQLSSSVAGGSAAALGSAVNYEVTDGDAATRITG